MKNKLNRLFIWLGACVVLFLAGTYVAMDFGTDYVLRSMADTAPIQPGIEAQISDKRDESPVTDGEEAASSAGVSSVGSGTLVKPGVISFSEETSGASSNDVNMIGPKVAPSTNNVTSVHEPQISAEEAKKAQVEITLKDKARVSSVLLKKLSPSDLSLLIGMSQDGITIEEKREAKKVILQKLTEEEYNELIAIAAKLGLSASGKSYQESVKEASK